ncbi:MAG: hypothetical protein U0988_10440 [Allopontixanthobacter sp.]|nr:hypothetical protein [Allopontixanthobacter sp.]
MRALRGVGAIYWDNGADLFRDLFGGSGLSGYAELWAANDNRMNKFNRSVAA